MIAFSRFAGFEVVVRRIAICRPIENFRDDERRFAELRPRSRGVWRRTVSTTAARLAIPLRYTEKLEWRRKESGDNWYYSDHDKMEGWLCPALFKYFPKAPRDNYVRPEPKS